MYCGFGTVLPSDEERLPTANIASAISRPQAGGDIAFSRPLTLAIADEGS